MVHFKLKELCFLVLVSMVISCGVPLPTDRTVVYGSRDVGYYKFKPVLKEKYNGDTLIISNYLIANTWTAPVWVKIGKGARCRLYLHLLIFGICNSSV